MKDQGLPPVKVQLLRNLLKDHTLRRTNIREQVLEVFLLRREAVSQGNIEEMLGPLDRITLYRTLRAFEEKGLIHRAIDGTGKLKFALCHHGCTPMEHLDQHAHLHCESCGRTVCMDNIKAPEIEGVAGFEIKSAFLVLQGICAECGIFIPEKDESLENHRT